MEYLNKLYNKTLKKKNKQTKTKQKVTIIIE